MLNRILFLITVGLGFVACTKDEPKIEEPVVKEEKHDFTVDKNGVVHFEAEIVYFNYDDHTLTPDGMERLTKLVDHMKKTSDIKLKIEGHCDERGSEQYNLALGQKRAVSVKEFLKESGVEETRLDTISFGEETPALQGHSEEQWAKNRRAEFKFIGH